MVDKYNKNFRKKNSEETCHSDSKYITESYFILLWEIFIDAVKWWKIFKFKSAMSISEIMQTSVLNHATELC
jgi:hypothetical protein